MQNFVNIPRQHEEKLRNVRQMKNHGKKRHRKRTVHVMLENALEK
jgi:hypothetical protein